MRLLTRADMDGVACAVLLTEILDIEEITFMEPQEIKVGRVEVTHNDIIANLPFDSRCGLWFDHHASNALEEGQDFDGAFAIEDSAARVIADHYGPARFERFKVLLEATDRVDAAKLTMDDVTNPTGYILLALTLDPKTGFTFSPEYFRSLMGWLREESLDATLARPVVKARTDRILQEQQACLDFLQANSHLDGNVVITDTRGMTPPAGSRFLIYTLFPTANVALKMHVAHDFPDKIAVSLGHSIFNKTCEANVGKLLAHYGGGGHHGAGSSRIDPERVDQMVKELLDILR